MKKIFTYSILLVMATIVLSSCSRRGYYQEESEQDYWMRKESGIVVYSDAYCPYYVVETYNGYTIIRATNGYTPYEGDEIFGDLSRRGTMDLYNYTDNSIIRGQVMEYWLTYSDAQYLIDNYCYSYSKSPVKKEIRQDLKKK